MVLVSFNKGPQHLVVTCMQFLCRADPVHAGVMQKCYLISDGQDRVHVVRDDDTGDIQLIRQAFN